MTIQNHCRSCRYWERDVILTPGGVIHKGDAGECRILPPKIDGKTGNSIFPMTLSTEWCGQHQPRSAR